MKLESNLEQQLTTRLFLKQKKPDTAKEAKEAIGLGILLQEADRNEQVSRESVLKYQIGQVDIVLILRRIVPHHNAFGIFGVPFAVYPNPRTSSRVSNRTVYGFLRCRFGIH